jgi:hypothetical protein
MNFALNIGYIRDKYVLRNLSLVYEIQKSLALEGKSIEDLMLNICFLEALFLRLKLAKKQL